MLPYFADAREAENLGSWSDLPEKQKWSVTGRKGIHVRAQGPR